MVAEKCKPWLRRIAAATDPSQVSCDGTFGDGKAGFLIFTVDPRRSPRRVLGRDLFDEIPHFPVDPRPPTPDRERPRQ
jgi:hypothetical protein